MCGFCAKKVILQSIVSFQIIAKKSIPFSHNSTFNTLCRIGFYTVNIWPSFALDFE